MAGLAFLDADVTIVEPEEFRRACAAFARRLLAATGHTDPPSRAAPVSGAGP